MSHYQATFLSAEERQLVQDRINVDRRDFENEHLTVAGVIDSLKNWKIWAFVRCCPILFRWDLPHEQMGSNSTNRRLTGIHIVTGPSLPLLHSSSLRIQLLPRHHPERLRIQRPGLTAPVGTPLHYRRCGRHDLCMGI